jgi:hypothetical protein
MPRIQGAMIGARGFPANSAMYRRNNLKLLNKAKGKLHNIMAMASHSHRNREQFLRCVVLQSTTKDKGK